MRPSKRKIGVLHPMNEKIPTNIPWGTYFNILPGRHIRSMISWNMTNKGIGGSHIGKYIETFQYKSIKILLCLGLEDLINQYQKGN